jgi:hypothetical protein
MKFSHLAVAGLVLAGAAERGSAATPSANPADYPALDARQLGQLRHIIRLSRQLPGDWSGMGTDWWDIGERAMQFELAYMADAVALAQHNYVPAYRQAYQPAMDALIQKMTLPDVWERWIDISRGGRNDDPDQTELGPGWMDPMVKDNVMLKGYLLQSGSLYELLYRDGKYDKPGAFTFKYRAGTWGMGPQTFEYDLGKLADITHREYVESKYEGVQCEPNRIFPTCNQSAVLGLLGYDQAHGTKYAADVMPKFKAAWVNKHYTDPVTKENVALVFVKQDKAIPNGGIALESWSGNWMNAWDPDYMKTIYPVQRDHHLDELLSGNWGRTAQGEGNAGGKIAFGMFALMAAEMSDEKTKKELFDYADRNFKAVDSEGEYYYPRSDDYLPDQHGGVHGMDTWTGNALLALARLDDGGGFRRMYTQPWDKAHFDAPYITDVDELTTGVSQAWYDPAKRALIVTLVPGPAKSDDVGFVVRQLDAHRRYTVIEDGKVVDTLDAKSGARNPRFTWRDDGTVAVSTDLGTAHSFVIAEN